ncbi:MAG: PIN domain-containing protein [Thaumarchaeota archaeon]|nr:PIN domain-containing protein [Nitrososphaerota archaeon]
MKLVVDTNVLLGALIKNSTTRSLLLSPNHDYYIPEYALEEVEKHLNIISTKSGLSTHEIKLLFDVLATNLNVVPMKQFMKNLAKAEAALKIIDEKDVPFLALALSLNCDGIWSNDKHLREQKFVRVWSTNDIISLLD